MLRRRDSNKRHLKPNSKPRKRKNREFSLKSVVLKRRHDSLKREPDLPLSNMQWMKELTKCVKMKYMQQKHA